MYSNKDNVNILTALLVAHGVTKAVLCPGSRNAPITHNLVACPDIDSYSVTDERSAGFYALGMAQAIGSPVAICVTSGSALLNLLPAVAEAFYQHVPLVVISADRPPQWIDQLDGQTLPQGDALGKFVRKAVTLPEPHDDETRWYCNRLVNEALLAMRRQGGGPVHINVPLTEPLYEFTTPELPEERLINFAASRNDKRLMRECADNFLVSRKPMIVVGQTLRDTLVAEDFARIGLSSVVLNESLSVGRGGCHFDEVLANGGLSPDFIPDFVLVLGGTLVSKHLKNFLRRLPAEACVWAVSEDGEVHDTFKNLCGLIEGHPADVLADLSELAATKSSVSQAFINRWNQLLTDTDDTIEAFETDYSQMAAVRMLETQLGKAEGVAVHYGNSMSVRLANIYARHFVYCNRGVNGIEGTLSTASGFSMVSDGLVFCVLGDLSFFYDANALWNEYLGRNLRVLLLNNGGGGIFEKFEGLRESPARERFVMAQHHTSAEGLCQSFGVSYRSARNMSELEDGILWLTDFSNLHQIKEAIDSPSSLEKRRGGPLLLEVFTDSAEDSRVLQAFEACFHSLGTM